MEKRKTNMIILAIIFFVMLIVTYSNHFRNSFHFDDFHTITDNIHIRDIKNIPAFFKDPRMFSSIPSHWGLRPGITTSAAIDYWMAKRNPFGVEKDATYKDDGLNTFYYHFSTFIWYIVICVLIFFIFRNLFNKSVYHKKY